MMWRLAFWWRGWRYHRGWRPATVAEQPLDLDFYGSMDYEAERALYWPAPARWEVAHERSGWWGQTAADLAPEALDGGCLTCNPGNPGWITCVDYDGSGYETACPDCSGPGAGCSAVAPGPDPEPELGPNAARVLARWEQRRRERWRLDWDNEAVAA